MKPSRVESSRSPHWTYFLLVMTIIIPKADKVHAVIMDSRGPVFIYEPSNQVDFSNMTGTRIECTAHGVPSPTVQWLRADGITVSDIPDLLRVLPNGTLVFQPFRAEDYRQDIHAVVYKCVASNPFGTIVSRDVKVRGVVKQFYEVQVYDEFVIKGNIAVLRCHVPSFVRDHVIIAAWLRDDNVMTQSATGRITISATGELYIREASAKDSQKNYRCRTAHKLTGEVRLSSPGRIIITDPQSSVPPRLTHSVASIQCRQGETVELPCTAQGFPVPAYKWYKLQGKQPVSFGGSDRIRQLHNLLVIQNVDLRDAGTYVCIVNNTVGEEKADTSLSVTASLSAYIQPQQQVVDAGKPTEMTCVISGYPVISVSWSRNGQPIEMGQPFVFPRREMLRIPAVRREDRGMYQCFAENDEESVQATAELRLGDASPAVHSAFQEQTIQPGVPAVLQCIVSGNPTPAVTWTLDGSTLPVNRRFQVGAYVAPNGDVVSHVNISTARVEDGGEYACSASNKLGNITHAARLNVWGLPFIRQMLNQTIVAGKDFSIRCPASGYPIHSINWEREGNFLPAALRQTVFPNGTLLIRSVERGDAGSYTCLARNNKGLSARKSLWVFVLDPPKIEPFSFPKDVREGMRARVLCSVVEGDPPVSIVWTKDDAPISHELGASVQGTDEYSSLLIFRSVSAAHNGNYTCTASNAAAIVSHTAELLVHVPPRWLNEPKELNILLGQRVELSCQASGFPQPNITWMKGEGRKPGNYKEIHHFGNHMTIVANGSLIIDTVQQHDDGYYLCQAANGIGSGLSKVVYLIINVPAYFEMRHRNQTARKGEDVRIQCEAWGDRPLEVFWNRNDRRIDFKEETRFTAMSHDRDGHLLAELVIKNADENDSALFTCVATNGFGHDESTIHLFIEEKPAAPINNHVTEFSSRKVALTWNTPSNGNSVIIQHIIQVKRTHQGGWDDGGTRNITIHGGQESGTVDQLLPGTAYSLRVLAENRLGQSPPSDPVHVTTMEEAPSGPPLAVEAKATSSESLKLIWKPPKKDLWNGELIGYYIGYKIYDSSEPYHYKTVDANPSMDTIELPLTGLRKFTKYSILVQAFNRIGRGPHSDEVIAVTSEDVPSEPPQDVQCITHTSQSLHVSWNTPSLSSQNGYIKGYKIFYRPTYEIEDDIEYHVVTTTALKTNLHTLEKYTNYSIQVLGYTRMGEGVRSESVYCRTLEDVPGPPGDIKALTMSSDSILVTWKPPTNKNGNIIKYTLYIRGTDNGKQHTTKHFLSSAPHLSHEARGLTENHNYDFWVTASTVIGEGESTRVVTQSPKTQVIARIASFSERVITKWKEDVYLPCRAVGLPTPTRRWITEDTIPNDSDRFMVTDDGSFLIKNVMRNDSAKYSCEVENIYGKDQITYQLVVQAPPSTPSIALVEATDSSIRVRVNASNKIKGFTLSYKQEFGEWKEIRIGPDENSILLDNLYCGTKYFMYLTAFNKVGSSEPSHIVNETTRGGAPKAPKMDEILVSNTTFIILNLHNWPDGGCPILYFVVLYKPSIKPNWTLISNNAQPNQHDVIIIPHLEAGAFYDIKVTAHNQAGSIEQIFNTRTISFHGEMAADEAARELPFLHDWSFIAIVIVSTAVLAVVFLFGGYFFIRRRKYRGYRHSYPTTDRKIIPLPQSKTGLDNGPNQVEMTYTPSPGRKYSLPTTRTLPRTEFTIGRGDGFPDNINPYATFNLSGCQGLQDVDLQALQLSNRSSRTEEHDRQIGQLGHNSNPNPFDLYSRVVKRMDNSTEESNQRNISASKFYPVLDGSKNISKGNEYYAGEDANLKYEQHPYQTWEGRRHHSEYDSVLSDTDNSDLGGSYFSESTVQLHGRGRVPDLIYHTTDSSTSNESSPDEERRRSRSSKKKEYFRNKSSPSSNNREYQDSRTDHVGQMKETTFTLQPKKGGHTFNYSAHHIFPVNQREMDSLSHFENDPTHIMNLRNHCLQEDQGHSLMEPCNDSFREVKPVNRDVNEDFTIRV